MTDKETRYLELESNLKSSYRDFFMFSLGLIKEISATNNNLKFAVVNMQIALELFLKYYFLKQRKYDWLFKSDEKITFKDFSIILNSFFSKDSELLVTHKEHLKNILNARNKIVHEGQNDWDDDIIINLINTTLFIQNVLNREFHETLFQTSLPMDENDLKDNIIWKLGSENFAKNLAKLNNKGVYRCWFCKSNSFVDKKIFTCDELEDEGFQCVTCFHTFYLHHEIGVAKCICGEETFVLDALNRQEELRYNGKCLDCDFKHFAYKCEHCESFFIATNERKMIKFNDSVYCSQSCQTEAGDTGYKLLAL